jgi:hypothetical protein
LLFFLFPITPVNSVTFPVIWLLREILAAPFNLAAWLVNFVAELFVDVVSVLKQTWPTLSGVYQIGSVSTPHGLSSETSIWGSLWKDLLCQVSEI